MTIKDSLDTAKSFKNGRHCRPQEFDRAGCHSGLTLAAGWSHPSRQDQHFRTNIVLSNQQRRLWPSSNPYDQTRTSGGSSGGSAAIVATGAVSFDIGSDTEKGAHPRPLLRHHDAQAHRGQGARTGHIIPFGGYLDRLTTIGPIARFVGDLGFLLPLIAGPDSRDPAVVPVPLRIGRRRRVGRSARRILY